MEKLIQEVKQALVRRRQVEYETGMSRTAIYTRMAAGTFPRSVHLGLRVVAWRRADLDAWIADPSGYRAEPAKGEAQ